MSPASKKTLWALLSIKALVISEFLNRRVGKRARVSLAFPQQALSFFSHLTLFIQNVKNLWVSAKPTYSIEK